MKRNIKEKAIHYSKIIATEKNFTLFIILTLVLIPLGEIATLVHNEYFVSQPVIVDFAGWVGSIMAVAYFITNRKKYYPSDFFLFTLFMFAVISSAFRMTEIRLFSVSIMTNGLYIIWHISP